MPQLWMPWRNASNATTYNTIIHKSLGRRTRTWLIDRHIFYSSVDKKKIVSGSSTVPSMILGWEARSGFPHKILGSEVVHLTEATVWKKKKKTRENTSKREKTGENANKREKTQKNAFEFDKNAFHGALTKSPCSFFSLLRHHRRAPAGSRPLRKSREAGGGLGCGRRSRDLDLDRDRWAGDGERLPLRKEKRTGDGPRRCGDRERRVQPLFLDGDERRPTGGRWARKGERSAALPFGQGDCERRAITSSGEEEKQQVEEDDDLSQNRVEQTTYRRWNILLKLVRFIWNAESRNRRRE